MAVHGQKNYLYIYLYAFLPNKPNLVNRQCTSQDALPGFRLEEPQLPVVSLRRRKCRLRVEIEALDLLKRPPGDALHVSIHASGRVDHAPDLLLALGPGLLHGLAFFFEVGLHLTEFLDDGFDAMAKTRPRQILVHRVHLGLLTFAGFTRRRDLDQQVTDGDGQRDRAFRGCDPDAVDLPECLDGFRQRLADNDCRIRPGDPLVLAQLLQPAVAPIAGTL